MILMCGRGSEDTILAYITTKLSLMEFLIGILSAYAFVIIIKFVAYWQIRGFMGGYFEIDKNGSVNRNFGYQVSCSFWKLWIDFLTPVPSITIKIERKLTGDINDDSNWEGLFSSDILNLFSFKGVYEILNRSIANKINKDADGWMEVTLFKKTTPKRIGINLHYLITIEGKRQWKDSDGYIIEKA